MDNVGGLEQDAPLINSMSPSPPNLQGKAEKSRVSPIDTPIGLKRTEKC